MIKTIIIYCAIYARYSSHLQKETSIEDQIAKCKQFAKSQGWIVLENQIYYDRAQSGTSIIPRKNLKFLLDIAKSGQSPFQYILVDDTSRVARNTREALQIFEELSFANIYCYFVSQGIDGRHETATEILTLHGMVDALYSRELAKKVRRGMEGQINRGFYVGSRVFGYRPVPVYTGKKDVHGIPEVAGYKLEIDPREAKVVKFIYKHFAEKEWSAKRIANYLNQQVFDNDWPTPPYGKEWGYNTISGSKTHFVGILNRELYIGRYVWNRRNYRKNPKTGKPKMFYNSPELWIVVLKPELRIISDELWQRAKNRQTNIETKTEGKYVRAKVLYSENLLSRISICGECHRGFIVVTGGKYQYSKYGCGGNWSKGNSVCKNETRINKEYLHKIIIKIITETYLNRDLIKSIKEELDDIFKKYIRDNIVTPEKKAIKNELGAIDHEISNIGSAIKQGILTETTKSMLINAEENRKELTDKLHEVSIKDIFSIQKLITLNDIEVYFTSRLEKLKIARSAGHALYSIVDKIVFQGNTEKAIKRVQEEMFVEIHERVDDSFIYFVNLVNSRNPRIRLQLGPQLIPYTKSVICAKFMFFKHYTRQSENTGNYHILSISRK